MSRLQGAIRCRPWSRGTPRRTKAGAALRTEAEDNLDQCWSPHLGLKQRTIWINVGPALRTEAEDNLDQCWGLRLRTEAEDNLDQGWAHS